MRKHSIKPSLSAESSAEEDEEEMNVVEYVAGTLDSWFGLGKEEGEEKKKKIDEDDVNDDAP